MSDLDLMEAVDAAAEYQFGIDHTHCGDVWADVDPVTKHLYREAILGTVVAAAPLIEAAVRARVGARIAGLGAGHESSLGAAFDDGWMSACEAAVIIAGGAS